MDNYIDHEGELYINISLEEMCSKPWVLGSLTTLPAYLKVEGDQVLFAFQAPHFWDAFAHVLVKKIPFIVKDDSTLFGYINMSSSS